MLPNCCYMTTAPMMMEATHDVLLDERIAYSTVVEVLVSFRDPSTRTRTKSLHCSKHRRPHRWRTACFLILARHSSHIQRDYDTNLNEQKNDTMKVPVKIDLALEAQRQQWQQPPHPPLPSRAKQQEIVCSLAQIRCCSALLHEYGRSSCSLC